MSLDPFHHHDVRTRLREHVAVEAREGVDAGVAPKPPGAFPSVRTRLPRWRRSSRRTSCRAGAEVVRHRLLCRASDPRAVGDRIAERGDGAGTGARPHFNARQAGTTSA